ncbi:MAG: protein-disulfide reductase DsbD family protein [Bacteroidales bacterium]|nr:protein-disulfide reductase DsbD family protein [Bacteroidales bacterium]
MKIFSILTVAVLLSLTALAQEEPVNWSVTQSRSEDGSYNITITADIHPDWYIYGMNIGDGGPLPLLLSIENQETVVSSVTFSEITEPTVMYDEIFEMNVSSYMHQAQFKCNYVPKTDIMSVSIIIDGQACNKVNGSCIQVYQNITVNIQQ